MGSLKTGKLTQIFQVLVSLINSKHKQKLGIFLTNYSNGEFGPWSDYQANFDKVTSTIIEWTIKNCVIFSSVNDTRSIKALPVVTQDARFIH